MPTPDQPVFGGGFMDDYFAEADEHLVTIRRDLLALESTLGSELPAAILEELFRSAHSLKGISAMVELHEAERLAHGMESCLRAIRQGQVGLESTNFETLIDAAKALEQVVQAHRRSEPMPAIDRTLDRLDAFSQSPPTTSLATRASADRIKRDVHPREAA